MAIDYKINGEATADEVIALYVTAGLKRPTETERMARMLAGSNLIITARENGKLVGIARSITDGAWSTYLADLAVDPNAQKSGIGKRLVQLTKEAVGDESMVLLLSVPTAMEYYPKIGMERLDNAFIIWRKN
jgi:N-acetylglutamate synthase-like GNAT family acetyltransferase